MSTRSRRRRHKEVRSESQPVPGRRATLPWDWIEATWLPDKPGIKARLRLFLVKNAIYPKAGRKQHRRNWLGTFSVALEVGDSLVTVVKLADRFGVNRDTMSRWIHDMARDHGWGFETLYCEDPRVRLLDGERPPSASYTRHSNQASERGNVGHTKRRRDRPLGKIVKINNYLHITSNDPNKHFQVDREQIRHSNRGDLGNHRPHGSTSQIRSTPNQDLHPRQFQPTREADDERLAASRGRIRAMARRFGESKRLPESLEGMKSRNQDKDKKHRKRKVPGESEQAAAIRQKANKALREGNITEGEQLLECWKTLLASKHPHRPEPGDDD